MHVGLGGGREGGAGVAGAGCWWHFVGLRTSGCGGVGDVYGDVGDVQVYDVDVIVDDDDDVVFVSLIELL